MKLLHILTVAILGCASSQDALTSIDVQLLQTELSVELKAMPVKHDTVSMSEGIQAEETIKRTSVAPFSWDTVPVYWYSADPWAAFDEETAAYAATHPLIVPNGNHMRWVEPLADQQEVKLVQVAEQIKAKQSGAKILFYLNTMMDWSQYSLHHNLTMKHQDLWKRNRSECDACVVCMRGQPIFDLIKTEMRTMWLDTMSEALGKTYGNEPLFYGVFADRTNPLPKGNSIPQGAVGEKSLDGFWKGDVWWQDKASFKEIKTSVEGQCVNKGVAPFKYHWKNYDAWNDAHARMVLDAQARANDRNQIIVANNNDSYVGGRHWEQWANNDFDKKPIDQAIQNMQDAVAAGKLVMAHTGHMEHPCSEGNKFALGLSSFLMGAGTQSYFSCTDGWLLDQGWRASQRHPEFDYPLGEPGVAVRVTEGSTVTWARNFSSATGITRVVLKVEAAARNSGQGCIYWSNGVVTGGSACGSR